jgi:transposase-like protein
MTGMITNQTPAAKKKVALTLMTMMMTTMRMMTILTFLAKNHPILILHLKVLKVPSQLKIKINLHNKINFKLVIKTIIF